MRILARPVSLVRWIVPSVVWTAYARTQKSTMRWSTLRWDARYQLIHDNHSSAYLLAKQNFRIFLSTDPTCVHSILITVMMATVGCFSIVSSSLHLSVQAARPPRSDVHHRPSHQLTQRCIRLTQLNPQPTHLKRKPQSTQMNLQPIHSQLIPRTIQKKGTLNIIICQ